MPFPTYPGFLPPADMPQGAPPPAAEASPYPAPDNITLEENAPAPRPLTGMAPYGMTPGVRHPLPGIPMPEDQAPPPAPKNYDNGIQFDFEGQHYELRPNLENSVENRAKKINALGQALMKSAHTDQEKAASERAAAWGLAMADTDMPIEKVISEMDGSYKRDTGYENALTRQALANEGHLNAAKANHPYAFGMASGGGGSSGPTKQDKFDHAVLKDHWEQIRQLVNDDRNAENFKKLSEAEATAENSAAQMSSANALTQYEAIAGEMLRLTGKQQTAREQQAMQNAAGAIEGLKNQANKWNPFTDNPQMTETYKRQFIDAMMTIKDEIRKQRDAFGQESLYRLHTAPFWPELTPEQQAAAEQHVMGSVSGRFPSVPMVAPQQSRSAPAPNRQRPADKRLDPSHYTD